MNPKKPSSYSIQNNNNTNINNNILSTSRENSTNRSSNKGPKINQLNYFIDKKNLQEKEEEAPEIPDTA